MKVALITGFPGQDACYLADLLLSKQYQVHGIIQRHSLIDYSNIEYLDLFSKGLELHIADVTDIGSLFDVVESTNPDEFYNLAAQSYVGNSWRLMHSTTQVDAIGPLNCLEVIRRTNTKIKFYQAGTSEMFGNSHTNGVQTEDTAFMPCSPYGVAKLYAHHIVRNFRESYGIFACNGILFNHESPIRGIEFVTRKVTDGVARIVTGKEKMIKLGNLNSYRDWGYAAEYVEAMWLMMQQERPDDFIVASGESHSITDLCRIAFARAGIDNWMDHVVSMSENMRPTELDHLQASCNKAREVLGWEARTSFSQLINMMVDEDIKRHS